MKDRIKPLDISIVSAYLGRFQTAIVALLVIAITAHAYLTRGSARGHVALTMAVPATGDRYEPLARLISNHVHRSVDLAPEQWDDRAELFVMTPDVYFQHRRSLDLVPLFSLSEHAGDRALIVGGRDETVPPTDVADVLFSGPGSINGCWVQLHALSRRKARFPQTADSLRFEPGADSRAVVWAVRHGKVRFGACRSSDLSGAGAAGRDEVNVLVQTPALPELIVASRAQDRDYFLKRLVGLAATFDSPQPALRDAVEVLRARGIGSVRAASQSQVEELAQVREFVTGLGLTGGNP